MTDPARIGGSGNSHLASIHLQSTGSSGAAATMGPTGSLGGSTVQHQATASAPGQRSGVGASIARWFKSTAPDALSGVASMIWAKIKPQSSSHSANVPVNLPPLTALPDAGFTAGPVKDIANFEYPGDYYENGNAHGASTREQAFGSVYATTKFKAEETNTTPAERNNFLRGNAVGTAKTAVMEGAPLGAFARSKAVESLTSDAPLAFTARAYKKGESLYTDVRDGTQSPNASKQAREAVRTAEKVFGELFGTPGDQASITRAASRLPQSFCNAVAVAVKGIDDAQVSGEVKIELRNKVMTDMIALRAVNPNLVRAQPGEVGALNEATQRNITEFSKFFQNVANNVPMGSKEAMHPAAAREMAKRGTEANLQAGFRDFCSAVLARADQGVVGRAVADGMQMKTDFDNRPKTS